MKTVFAVPGKLTIRGREFVIPAPTPADLARINDRMRELARGACTSPLAYVSANADGVLPAVLAEAVRVAVAMGSGGGAEPSRESVLRAFDSLEGVRFQVWYYGRKSNPNLAQDEVAALIPEDDRYDVADALFEATNLGKETDAPKPSPAGAV